MTCSLKDLPEKVRARVVNLQAEPSLIQYFMDMGIQNNIVVRVIGKLFFSSNYIIEVGNERLVLRKNEAQCLKVTTSF
jgi:Fe2+ transport system protein FeoA